MKGEETFQEKEGRMDAAVKKFLNYLHEAETVVFFGGAGVSTESGIPDFRSKDGLYNRRDVHFENYNPEYLLSAECLHYEPKVFYEFYKQKLDVRDKEPNITHHFFAKLEESGKKITVITQNIDGLHQKAGSKRVIELHGTTRRNYCEKCGKEMDENYLFDCKEEVPFCPDCKHLIRPDVTLYGESLPKEAFLAADRAIREADLFILAGTSLAVQPAASLVYGFHGKHMVILNREALPIGTDAEKDLVFTGVMGDVFQAMYDALF